MPWIEVDCLKRQQGLYEKDGLPARSSPNLLLIMLISVIIPVYNRAHCITRALESVKAQGIRDLEVILGDDASTDSTLELATSIFPDLKVARLPSNKGASAARNAALKLAKGNLIAFLDSDDEWVPGKLASQIGFLEDHPEVGLCGSGHLLMSRDGEPITYPGRNPPDWRRELHTAESFHGASTSVVRREVLESVGTFDERLRVLEDWDWLLRVSQHYLIHILPEQLAIIHENNPSDADQTAISLEYFVNKHRAEFGIYGDRHAANAISQHYENAARTFLRHDRTGEGCSLLRKSWTMAPLRNPRMLAAFPLAACDLLLGTKMLSGIVAGRSRRRLRADT
jgi:glycosyltransferase involved in cell wall biosynthesis